MLGLHFFFFVSGVAHASLATAVTLVAVEPALVLLVGVVGFKEKLQWVSFFGVLLCLAGIVVISVLPHFLDRGSLASGGLVKDGRTYGDLCAVFAVISYGIYYGLNRAFRPHELRLAALPGPKQSDLRRGFSLASIIYVFAALSAGLLMVGSYIQSSGGARPEGGWGTGGLGANWLQMSGPLLAAIIASGLIPTVLGHTLSQIVSRTAHPVWVSLMSPGETLCALMLGYVFLGQGMNGFEGAGGGLILSGVLLTAYGEARVTG
jgi:drug/metabolite transporter (DMT)-like permease